jgi:hypothetical protein
LEPSNRFPEKDIFPIVCGKGEQTPFKDECFGAVFLIGVLSYIQEDATRIQLLDEACRILKIGGFLFLSCFLISSDDYHQKKYREGEKRFGHYGLFESDSGGIFRHAHEEELRALLHNLHIRSWNTRPFTTMNLRKASGVIIEAQKKRRASGA